MLPPLLYASVQRTSWRQFAANVRPILLLAVALVFVTTAAVAAVADAVVPRAPIAAAVALGALVAPPDPVAATAVAGSLGLPRRMVSILEGEGLFNDVTAIVLYHVAIAAAVSGSFSWPAALGELVLSAVVAVVVGLALGWAAHQLMGRLGDATLQIGLTLLVPFVAYVVAEELRGSGVLAVLTTALFLAEHATDADDVLGRLAGHTFWEIVDTLVTGVAFGLIGLELHNVFGVARGAGVGDGRVGGDRDRGRGRRTAAMAAAGGLAREDGCTPLRDYERGDPAELAGDRRHVVGRDAGRGLGRAGPGDPAGDGIRGGLPGPRPDHLHRLRRDPGDAPGPGADAAVAGAASSAWRPTRTPRAMERTLAIRAAKAAKRRLKEIEEAEDLPEDLVEMLLPAGVRHGGPDQPRHGGRGAARGATRSGWSGSATYSASSGR